MILAHGFPQNGLSGERNGPATRAIPRGATPSRRLPATGLPLPLSGHETLKLTVEAYLERSPKQNGSTVTMATRVPARE
ncbi:MAG: hypothetical protein MZU79_01840 [Anaerotruncus sp.]|nr:hypothetical protein [Anaerotruncus sp.]